MDEKEILQKIKNLLGMGTNTANDDILLDLINVVKLDMFDSGVSKSVINSQSAIGTIVRGVIDNWNYGSGANYSTMYINGVIKLRAKGEDNTTLNNEEEIENEV